MKSPAKNEHLVFPDFLLGFGARPIIVRREKSVDQGKKLRAHGNILSPNLVTLLRIVKMGNIRTSL